VTSSSLEVLAALALNDGEFTKHMQVLDPNNIPKFYKEYVEEVQNRIEENARLEFECIWKEHAETKLPRTLITDKLSEKINKLNDNIQRSDLWKEETIRKRVLADALPKKLQSLIGLDAIIQRVPQAYLQAIFGAYLASNYIYRFGLGASEFRFFEFMANYTETGLDGISKKN